MPLTALESHLSAPPSWHSRSTCSICPSRQNTPGPSLPSCTISSEPTSDEPSPRTLRPAPLSIRISHGGSNCCLQLSFSTSRSSFWARDWVCSLAGSQSVWVCWRRAGRGDWKFSLFEVFPSCLLSIFKDTAPLFSWHCIKVYPKEQNCHLPTQPFSYFFPPSAADQRCVPAICSSWEDRYWV